MPRNQCHICNLVLVRSTDLGRHMKVHLSAEARDEVTYKCRYCDYSALQRSNLVTHEHTHTGGKPHKCPDCTLAYTDPGSLTRHRKKLHGYIPAPRVKKALSSKASRRVAPYKQLGETAPSPSSSAIISPATSDDEQPDSSFVWDKSITESLSEKEQAMLAELCSSLSPTYLGSGTASMDPMAQAQDCVPPTISSSPENKENLYNIPPSDWVLPSMLLEAANVPKTPMPAANSREGYHGMEWNSLLDVTNTASSSAGFSSVNPSTDSGAMSLQDFEPGHFGSLGITDTGAFDSSAQMAPLLCPAAPTSQSNTVQYPAAAGQLPNYYLDTTESTVFPPNFSLDRCFEALPDYTIPTSFPSDPVHVQGLVADPMATYTQGYVQYPGFN